MHGEVITYYLSPEELEERNRRRKNIRRDKYDKVRARKTIAYDFGHILREKQYDKLKKEGLTDKQIIKKITWLTDDYLQEMKKKWGK